MTNTQIKVLKAHQLVSRTSGTLALALGANRLGRLSMAIIVEDLREAADIVEGILKS